MNIGVITHYNYFNYGNRLQNLATQIILERLGHSVQNLVVAPNALLTPVNKVVPAIFPYHLGGRWRAFKRFTKEFLPTNIIDGKTTTALAEKYGNLDAVVIGSDQTWNPAYIQNSSHVFAKFVAKEKRLSFATSFGVTQIPQRHKQDFQDSLNEIKHISVRESAGADIVKRLTGKTCPVMLDPTLVLTKAQWQELANKSPVEVPKEKYLFTYFLYNCPAWKRWVKNFAKRHNLKIVAINKYSGKFFTTDPLGFVKLLMNAEIVCTSSFHGHAFSVCLEKPFVSFPGPQGTNSRISTLMKLTSLENRHFERVDQANPFEIDFTSTRPILDDARQRAINYLQNALADIEGIKND